ncbi:hypothetical protein DPMN_139158 [Dreissena polymorpha]|uniref:Rho guanine nucleotide exchange factor 6/7 coiled-coil domain-containing protein n=1 Tax=Dreissena polymorpha TaxID=45954 RepID=A0A9D4G8I9_DREPO|nr:hypothetical protein DPMN_139158 [Dreissena polymorpha]
MYGPITNPGAPMAILYSPNVLLPHEEKIIVDDGTGPDMLQEKSLVDTVYSLRDQVKALEMDHKKMKKDLEDETKARKSLENVIKKFMKSQQGVALNKDKESQENAS